MTVKTHPGTIWRRHGGQRIGEAFCEVLAGVPSPAVVSDDDWCTYWRWIGDEG